MRLMSGNEMACGVCGRRYEYKPQLVGRRVKCVCGQAATIPPPPPSAARTGSVITGMDPYEVGEPRRPEAATPPRRPNVPLAGRSVTPKPPELEPPIQPHHQVLGIAVSLISLAGWLAAGPVAVMLFGRRNGFVTSLSGFVLLMVGLCFLFRLGQRFVILSRSRRLWLMSVWGIRLVGCLVMATFAAMKLHGQQAEFIFDLLILSPGICAVLLGSGGPMPPANEVGPVWNLPPKGVLIAVGVASSVLFAVVSYVLFVPRGPVPATPSRSIAQPAPPPPPPAAPATIPRRVEVKVSVGDTHQTIEVGENLAGTDITDRPDGKPYREAGEALLTILKAGERQRFVKSIDVAGFQRRVLAASADLAPAREIVARAVEPAVDILFNGLSAAARNGSPWRFVGVRDHGDEIRALYRLRIRDDEGVVDYLELVFPRAVSTPVHVVDWRQFSQGDAMSKIVRRYILPGLIDAVPAVRHRLNDEDRAHATTLVLQQKTRIGKLIEAGKFAEALVIFNQGSVAVRHDPSTAVLVTHASRFISLDTYRNTVNVYANTFADNPSTTLMLLDLGFMDADGGSVRTAADTLARRTLDENLTQAVHAESMVMDGEIGRAKRLAQQVRIAEPALDLPLHSLLAIAIQERQHREAVEHIKALELLGADMPDLNKLAEAAELLKSTVYREWKARSPR